MDEPGHHDAADRRRHGTGGALVAMAAILGFLALAACGADSPAANGPTTKPTSSPTTTEATPTAAEVPVSEPTPAPTRPTYLLAGVVHRSDGSTFRPDVDGEVAAFTDLQDGRWALTTETGRSRAELLVASSSGAPVATFRLSATTALAVTADRTTIAWLDPDLRPQVLTAGASKPKALPPIGGGAAAGLTSDNIGSMAVTGDCANVCSVLVATQRQDGTTQVWRSSSTDTKASPWSTELLDVTDVSPDGRFATGSTKLQLDPTGLCSAMVEISTGKRVWETCKTSTLRFSPTGSHLLGIDPYLDGAYHAQQFVLDVSTGKILSRVQRSTSDETWLSDDSYVASELGPTGWRLVRHSLDGTSRPLTKPAYDVSGDETTSPYRLARS